MSKNDIYSIGNWIVELQKRGTVMFSRDEVEKQFPNSSNNAINFSLNRLTENKKIASVWKGFIIKV
jgi:hypothetical protein